MKAAAEAGDGPCAPTHGPRPIWSWVLRSCCPSSARAASVAATRWSSVPSVHGAASSSCPVDSLVGSVGRSLLREGHRPPSCLIHASSWKSNSTTLEVALSSVPTGLPPALPIGRRLAVGTAGTILKSCPRTGGGSDGKGLPEPLYVARRLHHRPKPPSRRPQATAGAIRTLPRLLMIVLNATIVNVAPPSIQEHLGYSRARVAVGCAGSMS
jgi:hypothetical protein